MKLQESLKLQIEAWFKYSHNLLLILTGNFKRPERPEYIIIDGMKFIASCVYSDIDNNKTIITYKNVETGIDFKIEYEGLNIIECI